MDINDKAVNVSVGTKERFKITIDNYISLGTVYALKDDLRGLSIAISMDDNQLRDSTIEKYTYKTIIKANREILKRIQKDYNAKRIKLDQIKKLFPLFKIIWSQFFILINDNKDKLIVRLEIFPIEICKYLKDDFEKHVYKEDFINLKDEINAEDFKNFLQPKVTKISEKINEINTKIEEFKNISERKKIISDWLKEETI